MARTLPPDQGNQEDCLGADKQRVFGPHTSMDPLLQRSFHVALS